MTSHGRTSKLTLPAVSSELPGLSSVTAVKQSQVRETSVKGLNFQSSLLSSIYFCPAQADFPFCPLFLLRILYAWGWAGAAMHALSASARSILN